MTPVGQAFIFDEGGGRRAVTGDRVREAVAAWRGYAYQVYVAAREWMALPAGAELSLEVAEDFAVAAERSLRAVQVKNRAAVVTLASRVAAGTIDSLVRLTALNPGRVVRVALLTTASVGLERSAQGRPAGTAGIEHWAAVADGADPSEPRTLTYAALRTNRTRGGRPIDEETAVAVRGLYAESRRPTRSRRIAGLARIFLVRGLSAKLPEWPEMLADLAEAAIDASAEVRVLFDAAPNDAELVPTLFGCAVLDPAS